MKAIKRIAKTSKRRSGRPSDSAQQDLKNRILNTSEAMFAERGYAATSIRQIAATAEVNTALVHYYFGNKHALLQAVLSHSLAPLMEALASFQNDAEAPVAGIAGLLLSKAAENPRIPQLLTREVLLPGGEMQQYFTTHMAPHLGGVLPLLLAREKSSGRLREEFDPAIAALLIIALSVFPLVARTLAEPVLGINFEPAGINVLVRHVADLLDHGMIK